VSNSEPQTPSTQLAKAALIGNGPHAETRAAAVRAADGATLAEHLPEATAAGVIQRREAALDVALLCGTPGRRAERAEAALRQGRHLFLEWPPAASVGEAERLAAHAEEAGAEVGVSRPLRFHPLFAALPRGAHVGTVSVRQDVERAGDGRNAVSPFRARLADALDLSVALAGAAGDEGPAAGRRAGRSVTHLDAQAVRASDGARFEALLAGLRFASGTYAQVAVRRGLTGAPRRRLRAAGHGGFQLGAALDAPGVRVRGGGARDEPRGPSPSSGDGAFLDALRRRETRAFLKALQAGRPAPVSLLDAVAVMRLTERLLRQVR
jgi:predicted dehydrogenase